MEGNMKRILSTTLLALGLAVALLTTALPAAAAPKAPTYSAVLTDDGACGFTLNVDWKNAKVATVYAQWYMDATFLFTTQAPFTGPNAGRFTGNSATFQTGPFITSSGTHDWQVLVQPYDSSGAQLASFYSNTDTVACSPDGT
jgi:hypothetical protein